MDTHRDGGPGGNRRTHFTPLADLNGKSVLITGGTGSFGQAFCKTVLDRYRLRKLIVFSRDELKQFEMQTSAAFRPHERVMRYFIGDVRDLGRLEMAFRGVDFVIHAAAMKQIPAAEYNPFECIHTNVLGAENVVRAAIRTDVARVVALSTDKAASPINLYGASKLAADKIFVAARNVVGSDRPMFSVVRYGNVLGSRGSVVPFFRQRIQQGASVLPITDPAMSRFWITLPQGVDFVLSCLALAHGSEIFVPKLPSMKVTDLARVMAPGLATEIVGIRQGEKLHEAMITEDDARNTLELPDRYVITRDLAGATRYHAKQVPVPAGFRYSSDDNTWWLRDDEMRGLLDALPA
ncbi:MAG: UDP-N-acetylglucosamine 4,6-dehydratase (inverting) [Alphaproteobacteria bacterium]|nr:UDP-N-acetylglucosamine 4,6-dehydratase (inverting) [Alphaproteobacteria bacterium]